MAEGVFVEARGETARAEEAQKKCEDLNEEIDIEKLIYETAIKMGKYGSGFWEKTYTPYFNVREIPRQDLLTPKTISNLLGVTSWIQRSSINQKGAIWTKPEIIQFNWNVTSKSWPYGTSLYVGLDEEFDILSSLENNIKKFMEGTAFPKELWQIGDEEYGPSPSEVSSIRSKIRQWEAGQTFVTSYPIDYKVGGVGNRRIENLPEVLNFMKDQAIDGLMMPPISKQYNATNASAQEMMPWSKGNIILPMQRTIKRKIEHEIYKPFLMDQGYSIRIIPIVSFNPPDADKEKNADYYSALVNARIISPKTAAKKLGFEKEYKEWEKEMKAQQELFLKQQREHPPEEQNQDGPEYLVKEVRRR